MAEEQNRPLRLLSLDGGGVRGLSELLILKRIMHGLSSKSGIGSESRPKPCEYFDLIGGTSTGGLIAIMLGTLEMDIDTCIDHYLTMAPDVFPEANLLSGSLLAKVFKGAVGMSRFDPKPLEEFVQRLVAKKFPESGSDTIFDAYDTARKTSKCKVFVSVTNKETSTGHVFRDYRSSWDPSTKCTIWQAARATSAAPLFFPPIQFGNPPQEWVDGGLRNNNPVRRVFEEANSIWPCGRKIQCIISVGAGEPPSQAVGDTGKAILQTLIRNSLDTKQTAQEFSVSVSQLPIQARFNYIRLNATGIHSIGLEEWKHFGDLTSHTNDYLNSNRDLVDQCVSLLDDDTQSFIPGQNFPLMALPATLPAFYGREQELELMRTILDPKKKGQARLAICGLSGFGKTRLALEFIEQRVRQYDYLLWIDASSRDCALESFLEAASSIQSLGIKSLPSNAFSPFSAQGCMRFVINWLETSSSTWLMVIDSFNSSETLNIREFFPRCHHGSIIITSTRSDLLTSHATQTMNLEGIDPAAGLELLLNKLDAEQHDNINMELASSVVDDLSGVALAIEQASFLLSKGFTLKEFQKHFNDNRNYRKLMEQRPARGVWAYEKNQSIFDSFETLYQHLEREHQDSATLLSLLCCFSPGKVPMKIFHSNREGVAFLNIQGEENGVNPVFPDILGRIRQMIDQNEYLNLKLAVIRLQDYCLAKITRGLDGSVTNVSIHDSIWRWCRSRGRELEMQAWSLAGSHFITRYAIAAGHERVELILGSNLNAHLSHCFSLLDDSWDVPPFDRLNKLFVSVTEKFARAFVRNGKLEQSKRAFILAIEARKLGQSKQWPDDRTSCELLIDLGEVYWRMGDLSKAQVLFQELLEVEIVRSDTLDDIAVQAASKLRQVKDRLESTRIRAPSAASQDGPGKAVAVLAEEPRLAIVPAVSTDLDDEYLEKEYELSEIASQMKDEFGDYDGDTLKALAVLASFYQKNKRYLQSIEALEPFLIDCFRAKKWKKENEFRVFLFPQQEVLHRMIQTYIESAQITAEGARLRSFFHTCDLTLHYAVLTESYELSRLLLEAGAHIILDAFGNGSNGMVNVAAMKKRGLVRLFVSHGAKVNTRDSEGDTPLHCLRFSEDAKLLLEAGADVHARDKRGRTPLHHQTEYSGDVNSLRDAGVNVHNGTAGIVELLLTAGADVNARDNEGMTPLDYARTIAIGRLLLEAGANVFSRNNLGRTPLMNAFKPEILELIIAYGADINAKSVSGATALHNKSNPRLMKLLIEAGADTEARDTIGRTPIHYATEYEGVKLLIEAGADIEAKDDYKNRPLHSNKSDAAVKLLTEAGADPNSRTENEYTPLHFAKSPEAVFTLVKAGADVNARAQFQRTPLMLPFSDVVAQALIEAGADVNAKDIDGKTAFDHSQLVKSPSTSTSASPEPAHRRGLSSDVSINSPPPSKESSKSRSTARRVFGRLSIWSKGSLGDRNGGTG